MNNKRTEEEKTKKSDSREAYKKEHDDHAANTEKKA
jgi:hypothetical protein